MVAILCFAFFVLGYFANDIARAFLTRMQRERLARKNKRGGVHYPQTPLAGRIIPTAAPEPLKRAVPPPPMAKPPAGLRFRIPEEPPQSGSAAGERPRLRFAPITAAPRSHTEDV